MFGQAVSEGGNAGKNGVLSIESITKELQRKFLDLYDMTKEQLGRGGQFGWPNAQIRLLSTLR